jgi:hypothetical protein
MISILKTKFDLINEAANAYYLNFSNLRESLKSLDTLLYSSQLGIGMAS